MDSQELWIQKLKLKSDLENQNILKTQILVFLGGEIKYNGLKNSCCWPTSKQYYISVASSYNIIRKQFLNVVKE